MRKTHLQNQSNWNISDKVHQLSGGTLRMTMAENIYYNFDKLFSYDFCNW